MAYRHVSAALLVFRDRSKRPRWLPAAPDFALGEMRSTLSSG
jgi:hypothetical protein